MRGDTLSALDHSALSYPSRAACLAPQQVSMIRLAFAYWGVLAVACGEPAKLPIEKLEDPATCAECHQQHYTEWSGSMHAYASDDPVFVAMNRRGQREAQLGTFCVQCHAPMAVALGLTDGTDFDPTKLPPQARGITCYFCHDVAKIAEDHNNGLQLALDDTMRGGAVDPVDSPAHHSIFDKQMASASNNSQMCGSCHDVVTPRGVALERTYHEWQGTIFAMNDPAHELPLTCSGCHMKSDPTMTVIADKPGLNVKSRQDGFHEHMWPGIDKAQITFPEGAAQTAAIQRDLDPALTIVGPTPLGGQIGGGGICVLPNNGGQLTVRIDTRGTGHAWPSGAAQDRRAWLEVIAYDASNNVVFSSGVVPDDKDPEEINDPNLFGLWDRIQQSDGTPAHFFWEVATVQSQLLRPPVTLVQTDPAFDHSSTATFNVAAVAGKLDHVTARVRIRPFSHAVLDGLVATQDLDPGVAASLMALDIAGSLRHWTSADAAKEVPFTGCVSDPFE
jgi:nitrate/TMAO reductase-like tetraheme cytochrome c subunit